MRISDWSSDVCSSDLIFRHDSFAEILRWKGHAAQNFPVLQPDLADVGLPLTPGTLVKRAVLIEKPFGKGAPVMWVGGDHPITLRGNRCGAQKGDQQKQQAQTVQLSAGVAAMRSEENTSELQSLMRISNAVFCLKNNRI